MNNNQKTCSLFLCLVISSFQIALVAPLKAWAVTTVMVESSSTGGFLVSAGDLKGVAGGEIRLDYTTDGPAVAPAVASLANGVQASLQPSGDSFGTVLISLSNSKSRGYVFLAQINLVDQYGNPGRIIPPYYARFTMVKGGQESASIQVANPVPGDKKPDAAAPANERRNSADADKKRQQESAQQTADVAVSGSPDTRVGAAPVSGEIRKETVVLVASPSKSAPAPPSKVLPPVFRRMEGVLDRFRRHGGEWTPDVIDRLFAPVTTREFHQEPAVMIADGVKEITVSVRFDNAEDVVNCFVIRGGQVASVQPGIAGEWLLNIVPGRGAMAVSVTVQTERNTTEYPLTVAPPLSLFLSGADAGTAHYLLEFVKEANKLATRFSAAESSSAVAPDTAPVQTP
jgi:hypothetical protein